MKKNGVYKARKITGGVENRCDTNNLGQAVWSKNVVALELDSIKEVESQSLIKMKKMPPFLDFSLLKKA